MNFATAAAAAVALGQSAGAVGDGVGLGGGCGAGGFAGARGGFGNGAGAGCHLGAIVVFTPAPAISAAAADVGSPRGNTVVFTTLQLEPLFSDRFVSAKLFTKAMS